MGGCTARRLRLLGAASLGGLYAAACIVPGLDRLASPLFQILFAALMLIAAFGFHKATAKQALFFLALSFAFGGAVLLVVQTIEPGVMLLGGRTYYAVSTPALLLLAGVLYALAAVVLSGCGTHTGGDIIDLTLQLDGRELPVRALEDTGNTLRDPVSGQAVLVTDWQTLSRLLPEANLTQPQLQDPSGLMSKLSAQYPKYRFRLIPYRAVGVDSGLLLAVRCGIRQKKGRCGNSLVAFSPTAVSVDGRFDALTGGQIT
jgi:stage II sporulation protein GA (sporulation sigma-E factor processing peptidase)